MREQRFPAKKKFISEEQFLDVFMTIYFGSEIERRKMVFKM
jgi:hypothetical protein